jgi:hypothetical protein
LNNNHGNRDEMAQPKPGISHPGPRKSLTGKYEYQSKHHKGDEQYVYQQDCVCSQQQKS